MLLFIDFTPPGQSRSLVAKYQPMTILFLYLVNFFFQFLIITIFIEIVQEIPYDDDTFKAMKFARLDMQHIDSSAPF